MCKKRFKLVAMRVRNLAALGADKVKMTFISATAADKAVCYALAFLRRKAGDFSIGNKSFKAAVNGGSADFFAGGFKFFANAVNGKTFALVFFKALKQSAKLFCIV